MSSAHLPQRRTLLIGLAAVGLVPLAGCMTKPMRPVNADGTYCHRIGKSYRPKLTCTPEPIPTAAAEAEAKRFEGTSGALTVFVLRRSWGDASVVVPVTVDGAAGAATIPESLVRLRLAPGKHILSAKWEGRGSDIDVDGRAGDVRVVELQGSGWAWGNTFSWQAVRPLGAGAREGRFRRRSQRSTTLSRRQPPRKTDSSPSGVVFGVPWGRTNGA